MPNLRIQLDEATKVRLRMQAARNGRSMEEEAREILLSTLSAELLQTSESLADKVQRRFASIGGLELELPDRDAIRKVDHFHK